MNDVFKGIKNISLGEKQPVSFEFQFALQEQHQVGTENAACVNKKKNKKKKKKSKAESGGIAEGQLESNEKCTVDQFASGTIDPSKEASQPQQQQPEKMPLQVELISDKAKRKKKKKKRSSAGAVFADDFDAILAEVAEKDAAKLSTESPDKKSERHPPSSSALRSNSVGARESYCGSSAGGEGGPVYVSWKDPRLDKRSKARAKFGEGKNLVAVGPLKYRDPRWKAGVLRGQEETHDVRPTADADKTKFSFSFSSL